MSTAFLLAAPFHGLQGSPHCFAVSGRSFQILTGNVHSPRAILTFRSGTSRDLLAIQAAILRESMNPIVFNAKDFIVAEDEGKKLVGFGQVRSVGGGKRELASLIVQKEKRGEGIGSALVRRLLEKEMLRRTSTEKEVYVLCLGRTTEWYTRFGFKEVEPKDLPQGLRLERCVGTLVAKVVARDDVIGMKWSISEDNARL